MSLTPTIHSINPSLQRYRSLRSLNISDPFPKFVSNHNTSPKLELFSRKSEHLLNQINNVERIQESTLTRVRSFDHFSKLQIGGFWNLLEIHQKQNDNLKEQNRFLMKQIQKKSKNETILNNQIEQLRKQIKQLERANRSTPLTIKSKGQKSARTQTSKYELDKNNEMETQIDKEIDEDYNYKNNEDFDELKMKFNNLMQRCSQQKCKKTRALLRQKLAETANKMRKFRLQLM